jgi:hypothetical protein
MFVWASRRRQPPSVRLLLSTCVSALSWVCALGSIHEDSPESVSVVIFGHDDSWPWDWREPQLAAAAAGTSKPQIKPPVHRGVGPRSDSLDELVGNPPASPSGAADFIVDGVSTPSSELCSIGAIDGVTAEGPPRGVALAGAPFSGDPPTEPIKVLRSSALRYPRAARSLGLGSVRCTAHFRLDRRGRPLDIEVTACPEPFHGPLRLDLARWRFHSPEAPGTHGLSLQVTYDLP